LPEPVDGIAGKAGRGVGIPIDSSPSRRTRYPGATLSLFGFRAKAFGAESETIGAMLANHAAIALIHERRERQFRAALASRDIIGQATGMIMERFDVDKYRAFSMLKVISQSPILRDETLPPSSWTADGSHDSDRCIAHRLLQQMRVRLHDLRHAYPSVDRRVAPAVGRQSVRPVRRFGTVCYQTCSVFFPRHRFTIGNGL